MKSRIRNNSENNRQIFEKLQNVQKEMQEKTDEIEKMEFSSQSGGGAVKIVVDGGKNLKKLEISPDVIPNGISKEDTEMLQDLITSALTEAFKQVDDLTDSTINGITEGIKIPGVN